MSKTTRIGVANLPGLEDVLSEAGYHVVSGQRFRDAALNIKTAMTSQTPPNVVLVGDFNQVGLKAWAEKLSRETTLRAIATPSGGAFANHPTVDTIDAPAQVWDVLGLLGIDTPSSPSPVIDSNGITQVGDVDLAATRQPEPSRTFGEALEPDLDPWTKAPVQATHQPLAPRSGTQPQSAEEPGPDPWGRHDAVAQTEPPSGVQAVQQYTGGTPVDQQSPQVSRGGPAQMDQPMGHHMDRPGPPRGNHTTTPDPGLNRPGSDQPVQPSPPAGPTVDQSPAQQDNPGPIQPEPPMRSRPVRHEHIQAPPPPQQPPQTASTYEQNPPTQPLPRLPDGVWGHTHNDYQRVDEYQPPATYSRPYYQDHQQQGPPPSSPQPMPQSPAANPASQAWPGMSQQAPVAAPPGQWATPGPPAAPDPPAQQPTWAAQPSAPVSSRMPNQWSSNETYQAHAQGLDQFGDVFDQSIADHSPGGVQVSDAFASVLIIGAGKGGVGKTSLSIATAQRAALAGYTVILVDSNRGQAGTGIRLRLRKSNLPTIADAAHSGKIADALVTPKQINAVRSGANLEEIKFGVIQAPPPSQASRRLVTNELYAKAIAFAKQKADLVVIDTQIAEAMAAADDTIYREVLVPTLRANDPNSPTSMLMLTEHGRESYNHLGDRVLELHNAGVQRNRVMMLLNTAPPEQPRNNLKQLGFDDYGEWVGVIDYDPRLMQTFNSGRTGAELDSLAPVLDHLLFRVTNDNEAFPSTPMGTSRMAAPATRRSNREQDSKKKKAGRKGFFARLFSRGHTR